MKRKWIFLPAAIIFFMMSSPSYALYYSFGYGGSGSADANNFTMEIGSTDIRIGEKTYLGSISIPFINHGDSNIPSGTIDSKSPHNNNKSLGLRDEGMEIGILGKIGRPMLYPKTYVNLICGFTRTNNVKIVRSNPTGNYYAQSTDSNLEPVIGAGVSYFPELFEWGPAMILSLDIDNRRGITTSIGWCW
ncbi:MAG: hypothetical protein JRI86_05310 [Deltaproteobacteria bacterium]|nr:hypothetical protein [Deltaproteobacteria bacterium]